MPQKKKAAKPQVPDYLVLFREVSEKNEKVLADTLRMSPAKGAMTKTKSVSVARFAPRRRGGQPPTMLRSLGIASVDLDRNEIEKLERQPNVEVVVRNEMRHTLAIRDGRQVAGGPEALNLYLARDADRRWARDAVSGGRRSYGSDRRVRGGSDRRVLGGSDRRTLGGSDRRTLGGSDRRTLGVPGGVGWPYPLMAYYQWPVPFAPFLADAPAPMSLGPAARASATHSWCLDLIGVSSTYGRATGRGVKVAVLDTGIDLKHPDFRGRLTTSGGAGSATAVSFVQGETVQDDNGHGTHCAGVVAGPASSSGGMRYGVAPDVDLHVGKVLSDDGSGYDSDILEAIAWAVDRGARVISLSLGSARRPGEDYPVLYETVAQRLIQNGTLLVAAAGNESDRPESLAAVGSPASCPSLLAVAAVDSESQVGWFSSAQLDSIGLLDVSAPGVDVYSAVSGGKFELMDGTSMACPHVAGIAALHLELQPDLSAYDLWWLLEQKAIPLQAVQDTGRGLVQAP